MKNGGVIRFCVGNKGDIHSSVWRLWSKGNDDLYLAARSSAHISKFSFHKKGWRFAVNENVQRKNSEEDRAIKKWERPEEFLPGWTRCFGILVPPRITSSPFETIINADKDFVFVDPPSRGKKIIFNIIFSPKTAESDELVMGSTHNLRVLGSLSLASEKVWLVCFEEDYSTEEDVIVRGHFNKTKINIESIGVAKLLSKASLHLLSEGLPYFVIDIELGQENIEVK